MRRLATVLLALAPLLAVAGAPAAKAPAPALSDAVTAPRPIDGEWFGIYLNDKKVGWYYTNLKFAPGRKDQVVAVNEFVFKAIVGTRTTERLLRETRTYEAKPGGRLLSFVTEQKGDGGDQVLEGTATPTGMRVLRKRPDLPTEVLSLKPSKETVEDADQARVVVKRQQKLDGWVTDGIDLEQYRVTTTPAGTQTRTLRGVPVKVFKVVTISEKEKVPTDVLIDEQGRVLDVIFGATMRLQVEPMEVAKNVEHVEVFGLTRVVLPKALPDTARLVPGQVRLLVQGLPPQFRRASERQRFKELKDGSVEVTLSAATPKAKKAVRPVADPAGGANLKATLSVEAAHPDVVALAKSIVGAEKDAHAAAVKISRWVGANLTKDYGASSDRTTDVLRTRRGDCTEHALLAVSLMRAVGIPSRRVDGLVYLVNDDDVPALYWHEWVEAFVGEWTQLDPTFGQDVADATHFAVGEEGNAEITPLIGMLKVKEVL